MIGSRLGHYQVEEELGAGGMGTVYRATDADGASVAVKIVHPHLLRTPGFFKRFMREADIGRRVEHGNVVRTLDIDALEVDGTAAHFLVMEFVEGQTLRAMLTELGRVPEELCMHIAREVLAGLEAIHGAGVIHRDLKPENVLITPGHAVKVMDLGVARLADEALRLSRTGEFLGSILYAAPEQWANEDVDHRVDLYALGVMLYELAGGKHPFRRGNPNIEAPSVAELNPQLSPFFEEVTKTLMAREPDERFASAAYARRVFEEGEESEWWSQRSSLIRSATRQPLRRPRIPRDTGLHGRAPEMAKLLDAFAAAVKGEGQVRLVCGEPGIGKTRLVDEFVGRLQVQGESMHFLFGAYPPGGAATATGAFSTAYREHFGSEGLEDALAEHLPRMAGMAPAFGAILRGTPPPQDAAPLTSAALQTVFVEVTAALAADKPTIVLIDDLDFAPPEGRALFAALARAVAEHPVLLLGTFRGAPPDELAGTDREPHVEKVELQRLGPKDLSELLTDALGSQEVAAKLSWRIAERSDGNPFFVFEILRDLRDSGLITKEEDGSWSTTGVVKKLDIPSSVRDLIQERLSHLEDEDRELLELASCWSSEFDPSLVAEASGEALLPTLKRFARLEQKHRVIRAAGRRYRFDNHQIRDALYDQTFEQIREQYHLALGDALEKRGRTNENAGLLCEQFLLSGEPRRSMPYLDDALDQYINAQLVAKAEEITRRALSIEGLLEGERRCDFLLVSGGWLWRLGRNEEERAQLTAAHELALTLPKKDMLSRTVRAKGTLLYRDGKFEEAMPFFLEAIEIAREAGNRPFEGYACSSLGNTNYRLGRYEKGMEWHLKDRAIAIETEARPNELIALANHASGLHYLGRFDEAVAEMDEAADIARDLGLEWRVAQIEGMIAHTLLDLGRYAESMERLQREEEVMLRLGERRSLALASHNHAICYIELGDYGEARRRNERCLKAVRELEDRYLETHIVTSIADIDLAQGREAEARKQYREVLNVRRQLNFRAGIVSVLVRLALLDEKPKYAEEALQLARDIGAPTRHVQAAAVHAMLGGDPAEAIEKLEEFGRRVETPEIMKARYRLWKGTGDAAHLEEARELLEEIRGYAPPQYRDSMLQQVPLYAAITSAE